MSAAVFEAFGVKHLSASSLNKWTACRGAWVSHYVFGIKGKAGPAAWRGGAVEDGLTAFLTALNVDPLEQAMMTFEREGMGDLDEAIDKERQNIEPMLEQAKLAWAEESIGAPITQQIRTETWFDGVDVPMVGYADYVMDGYTLDLKTTLRCPSKPSFNHVLQIAGYAKARGEDRADLLYVTPKKYARYSIGPEEIAEANADVRRRAIGLQATLRAAWAGVSGDAAKARLQLAKMCPPNGDSFYWSDDELAEALEQIPVW